jgi:hypothetical protein
VGAQELAPLSRDVGGPTALDNVFKKISSWVRVLLPE